MRRRVRVWFYVPVVGVSLWLTMRAKLRAGVTVVCDCGSVRLRPRSGTSDCGYPYNFVLCVLGWGSVIVLLWLCYLRAASDGGFMNVSGAKCTGCLWVCKDVWVWSLKFLWHRVCGWKVPVTVPSWQCVCPSGWCVRSGQILVLSSRLFPFCDRECSEQPPLLWTLSFPPSHG